MNLVEVMYKRCKMAEEQQFKRNIAYKLRIGDILIGNNQIEEERFVASEIKGKRVVRVNVVGSIVDRYESEGESKYLALTLDDGSGQIKLKSFGDDVAKFKEVTQGKTVIVIGNLRFWNNEIYITPEIIKEQDPRYLVIRKLELEKSNQEKVETPTEQNQNNSLKDNLIELIKNSESEGGISVDTLNQKLGNSPEVGQGLQKLLEEGMIFEPRPGVVRWLG